MDRCQTWEVILARALREVVLQLPEPKNSS